MSTWNDVGGNPAPGDPGQIRTVANYFGELSVSARFARRQLAALQRGELQACWTGVAADAFADELDILPADLGKLERSLDHASSTIHRWATTVDHAQSEAERRLREHDSADRELRTARYERDREREAALADAANDPVGAIGDVLSGNNRLAPHDRRVDDAYDRVRRVRDSIDQLRDDVDATARTVARLLEEASRLGIRNKDFFEKFGDFLEDLRQTLIVILRVLDEFIDLIAPFLGLALIIAGILTANPAFALAGLALATADFGVTAGRALLGDDTVTAKDLIDDAIDVGLAALGVATAYASAAKGAGAFAKGADIFIDSVAGGKAIGDIYGILFVPEGQPGSVFDAVWDIVEGPDGSGGGGEWPIELPNPNPEPAPMPGPDPAPEPGPMPGPEPAPEPQPGPEPGPMPVPDPAPEPGPAPQPGPVPRPDVQPVVGGGLGSPSADFAPNPVADFSPGADAGVPSGDDLGVGLGTPDLTGDPSGTADVGGESGLTGLVPDSAPPDAAEASATPMADVTNRVADTTGGTSPTGLIAGAAAVVGLAGAAAGAKHVVDKHKEDDEVADGAASDPWRSAAGRPPSEGVVVAVLDPATSGGPDGPAGFDETFDGPVEELYDAVDTGQTMALPTEVVAEAAGDPAPEPDDEPIVPDTVDQADETAQEVCDHV